jgi:hypothetical protein
MAKRYNLKQTDACRDKIQVSQLLNVLNNHIFNGTPLLATQLKAIEMQLDRKLPRLSAQEITGDVTQYVARLPQPAASVEAWTAATTPAPTVKPIEPGTKH